MGHWKFSVKNTFLYIYLILPNVLVWGASRLVRIPNHKKRCINTYRWVLSIIIFIFVSYDESSSFLYCFINYAYKKCLLTKSNGMVNLLIICVIIYATCVNWHPVSNPKVWVIYSAKKPMELDMVDISRLYIL